LFALVIKKAFLVAAQPVMKLQFPPSILPIHRPTINRDSIFSFHFTGAEGWFVSALFRKLIPGFFFKNFECSWTFQKHLQYCNVVVVVQDRGIESSHRGL
jgi:hypothetical protein